MKDLRLAPTLEVGSTHGGMLVVNKTKTDKKCFGAGEGPCGQYYLLAVQAEEKGTKDIYQCDCCRRITQV